MMMRSFILLAGLGEIIVGLLLLFAPGFLPEMASADAAGMTFTRMYGAAALAIGFLAFQVWQHMESTWIKPFFSVFALFHAGVALSCYKGYNMGGEAFLSICILHSVLMLMSLYFYFRE